MRSPTSWMMRWFDTPVAASNTIRARKAKRCGRPGCHLRLERTAILRGERDGLRRIPHHTLARPPIGAIVAIVKLFINHFHQQVQHVSAYGCATTVPPTGTCSAQPALGGRRLLPAAGSREDKSRRGSSLRPPLQVQRSPALFLRTDL